MTLAHDLPAAPRLLPRSEAGALPSLLPRLARQRLVQFAVLGGALFAIAPRARTPEVIDVTTERLAALRAAEVSRGKGPVDALVRAADQRALEDEILYREGVRLGLDKNDGIVRQRVVQKVLFLAEEMAGAARPADEAALRTFFAENSGRWAVPEQHRFAQIYRRAPDALAAWAAGPRSDAPPTGEASPVGPELDLDERRLADTLGADFTAALPKLPVGVWAGPVKSAFGWHLVRVLERRPARQARFEEVRAAVVEAYGVHLRQEATAAFVQGALTRYRVSVDGKRLEGFTPSRRVAFRGVASGED